MEKILYAFVDADCGTKVRLMGGNRGREWNTPSGVLEIVRAGLQEFNMGAPLLQGDVK